MSGARGLLGGWSQLRHTLRRGLQRTGWDLHRFDPAELDQRSKLAKDFPDFDPAIIDLILEVSPYTLTSPERIFALVKAVEHLVQHSISGAIVECGVWKGGSILAAIRCLERLGDDSRDLYLFDTFEGMTEPGAEDVEHSGLPAAEGLARSDRDDPSSLWCRAPIEGVRELLASTSYPAERIHFIQGKVENTLPAAAPEKIALLRLDTDWYTSTLHELVHLFPRIVPGGVLLIDDYGHWQGARRATEEYLADLVVPMMLHRIDYTGRIGIKPRGPGRE